MYLNRTEPYTKGGQAIFLLVPKSQIRKLQQIYSPQIAPQIRKMPHLRKVRKSIQKFRKFEVYDLRNLFADRPPLPYTDVLGMFIRRRPGLYLSKKGKRHTLWLQHISQLTTVPV